MQRGPLQCSSTEARPTGAVSLPQGCRSWPLGPCCTPGCCVCRACRACAAQRTAAHQGACCLAHTLSLPAVRILRRSVLAQHPVALRLPPLAAVATVLSSQGSATQRLGPAAAAAMPDHNAAAQPASGTEAVPPGFEAGPTVRPCSSLNGSRIVAAAFDAVHSSRAYAVADDGRLLALVVGGSDRGAPAGCTARTAASLPAALAQAALAGASAGGSSTHSSGSSALLHGAVNMAALPGYVLMTAGDQLAVFNVSSAPRRAPRLLLQQHLPLLLRQLGSVGSTASGGQQGRGQGQAGQAEGQAGPAPLLAAGHTHVAVTLGARTLALFEASLPYRLPAQPYRTSLAWMQAGCPAFQTSVPASSPPAFS